MELEKKEFFTKFTVLSVPLVESVPLRVIGTDSTNYSPSTTPSTPRTKRKSACRISTAETPVLVTPVQLNTKLRRTNVIPERDELNL